MRVGELMERLGGRLVAGSAEAVVSGVGELEQADASLIVFAESASGVSAAAGSGVVVIPEGVALPEAMGGMVVVSAGQPRLWFAQAARLLRVPLAVGGVHQSAVVAEDAQLGADVTVGACAVVESGARVGAGSRIEAGAVVGAGVKIGRDCRIYPRAVVYAGTEIGDRVVVHAGAVLGADGFGYVRDQATGRYTQFPQQGRLVIEDDVEIGANTTIDRGALAETRIGRGTKIDNLVHVGHNCRIGEDVVMASLCGVSGSSTVGNGAVLAGQVGIGDHAHVGDGVILGGQAGVLPGKTETRRGTVLWGTPAKPLREYLRELATLSRLSKMNKMSRRGKQGDG